MFIYVITNKVNSKQYVGQTIRPINIRMTNHRCDANKGSTMAIHRAMRKYGFDNFSYDVIDTCSTRDELNESEKNWIVKLDTFRGDGYNSTSGGENYIISEEVGKRIGESNRGSKRSIETRQKISESQRGRIHSKETRDKISRAKTGTKLTKKHRENISKSQKGKVMSKSARENMSKAQNGKTVSKETRDKISQNSTIKRPVSQYTIGGVLLGSWSSQTEAFKETGVKVYNISKNRKGTLKTTGGHVWKFDDV